MNLFSITWRSLRTQPAKKIFLFFAVLFCFTAVLSLHFFVQTEGRLVERQFDAYGANIIITPRTEELSLNYGDFMFTPISTAAVPLTMDDVARISTIHNARYIRAVAPKLIGPVTINAGAEESSVLISGVNFPEELAVKAWWTYQGNLPQAADELIVGTTVASLLQLEPGSRVSVQGASYRVSGILNPQGTQDDRMIFADYQQAAGLLNRPGQVTLAEVSALCHECPLETIVDEISAAIPGAEVKGIEQIKTQRIQLLDQFSRFALLASITLALLCGLLVFSFITSSTLERSREIGIMRTIGYRQSDIMTIILSEAAVIALAAGVLGSIGSLVFIRGILPFFSAARGDILYFDPLDAALSLSVLLAVCLVFAYFPAARAGKTSPVSAINTL